MGSCVERDESFEFWTGCFLPLDFSFLSQYKRKKIVVDLIHC